MQVALAKFGSNFRALSRSAAGKKSFHAGDARQPPRWGRSRVMAMKAFAALPLPGNAFGSSCELAKAFAEQSSVPALDLTFPISERGGHT
jgi:hypothetical protein